MSLQTGEAEGFAAIEGRVEAVIRKTVSADLEGKHFSADKVSHWTHEIIEKIIKGLRDLDSRFKYLVTGVIMQKNGAGMVTSFSPYWHSQRDGFCRVSWETEFLHAVITCYGLALDLDGDEEEF